MRKLRGNVGQVGDHGTGSPGEVVLADLIRGLSDLRAQLVDDADTTAGLAEDFARILEQSASRDDKERRLAIAGVEREVAAVEHRNADRLRARASDTTGWGPYLSCQARSDNPATGSF
jgi:hypothetical protein